MDDLKYVIVLRFGLELAILLDEILQHAEVSGTMVPVSAGFCRIRAKGDALSVECWGESYSLGRHSRGQQDAAIIREQLERTRVR